MKCNQFRPGFELVSPCPFPTTLVYSTAKDGMRYWESIEGILLLTIKPFCFVLPASNFSLVYVIFRMSKQYLWSRMLTMRWTWTCLLSSMPSKRLTKHFLWGNTCVLFNLGNWCISSYVTHVTDAVFLQGPLLPVYVRKQVHILLCHSQNLRGTSAEETPASCLF